MQFCKIEINKKGSDLIIGSEPFFMVELFLAKIFLQKADKVTVHNVVNVLRIVASLG